MDWLNAPRKTLFAFFILAVLSVFAARNLHFTYDFERFFPSGDPDLEFYYQFRQQFEPDDNFLLVALPTEDDIFDSAYLHSLDTLTRFCTSLPWTIRCSSITNFRYLIKSPFGFVDYPAIHPDNPERFSKDSLRLADDPRIFGKLVNSDFSACMIAMNTVDSMAQSESERLIDTLELTLGNLGIEQFHLLGKANFQKVIVHEQKRDFIISTLVAALLVSLMLYVMFRRLTEVAIALLSVGLSMLLFIGYLGISGGGLDLMSALYPILMIIVGISDVVHIVSKYHRELQRGQSPVDAMRITRSEIGLATLLTSMTTAIGFLSLIASRVPPVRAFGMNAAVGVIIAFFTILIFSTSLLTLFPPLHRSKGTGSKTWNLFLERFYTFGKNKSRLIGAVTLIILGLSFWGISKVSTDVQLKSGLPRHLKLTEDFLFFEREFNGFRPLEIAVLTQGDHRMDDPEVLIQTDRMETRMKTYSAIGPVQSPTMIYKSIMRARNGDRSNAYTMPQTTGDWRACDKLIAQMPDEVINLLISRDYKTGRMSSTISDIGTDSISQVLEQLTVFANTQLDTSVVKFRMTGMGIIFDKNNEYMRSSLIGGLSLAFLTVSILMGLLFRKPRMLLISLIPNIIPLLIGAALFGWMGIALDASTSIIFAVSFGIAVDDTIHYLSKIRHEINCGSDMETAIKRSMLETGQAIIVTSIILFFGFMILLISRNPATFHIGLLVSITLFSALLADLLLLPILLRKFWPGK